MAGETRRPGVGTRPGGAAAAGPVPRSGVRATAVHPGAGRVHAGQMVPRALRCRPRSRSRPPGPCAAKTGSTPPAWPRTGHPTEAGSPKTKVTSTRSASSQMGHCSPDGSPRLRAARSSSGWASHTSRRESRPFRNSRTTALRASRYSTRPPVGDVCTPSSAPGRKLTPRPSAYRPAPESPDSPPSAVRLPRRGSDRRTDGHRPRRSMSVRRRYIALIYRVDISCRCAHASKGRPKRPDWVLTCSSWPSSACSRSRSCTATRSGGGCATSSACSPTSPSARSTPPSSRLEKAQAVTVTESAASPTPAAADPAHRLAERRAGRAPCPAGRAAHGAPSVRARSTGSPTPAAGSSSSCWTTRSRPAPTTPAASVCGSPSPATWPRRPAWRLLERRRSQLARRLAADRMPGRRSPASTSTPARWSSTAPRRPQHDIAWLDRLIETERQKQAAAVRAGRRPRSPPSGTP